MAEARFTCSQQDAAALRKILVSYAPRLQVTEPARSWWRRFLSGESVFVVTGEQPYIERASAEVSEWAEALVLRRAW
jgi:uncharacterized protein YllA (UPF0747 family)